MRSFEGDRNFNQQHENVSQRIKENGTAVNNFREIMRNNVKKEENSESASSRKGLSTISHKEQKRVAVKSDSGKRFEDCYDDKERPKERYSSLPGSTAIFKLNVGHLTLGKDAGNAKMSRELESTESDQKTGNHRIRTSRNAPFGKSITKNAKKFSGDRYCLEANGIHGSLRDAEIFKRESASPTHEKQMTCETQFILVCRSRISNRQKITHTIREELKLDNVDLLPLELLDTREILIFLPKSMALKMFTISVKELTIKITLANHVCALPWSTQEPSNGIRCLCEDILSKLEKVLLLRNVRFLTLKSFEDKAFLRDKDGFKSIEYGFVNKVKELELDLDRITSLLSETCFEGCEAYNGMITEQHTASSSLSRIAKLWSDYQFTIKKFHSLEGELRVVREFGESGVEDHEKSEDLHDQQSEESIYKIQEGYKSSQNSLRINEGTSRSECNSGERIPFPQLLETISKSLTPKDWVRLREEISYDPPFAGIDQFQNGIEIFNQLHRIRIIDENKVDYIRRLFYSIERVDLVHVIDCCGEGDYRSLSFLNELPQTQTQVNAGKKETQNNGRDGTTKIPSPEDDSYPTEPQQAAHNSRELQEGEGPSDATNCTGVHNLHHSMLAKEHTEESSRVFEEDGDTLKQHEHPEVSCEHYDRFCTAKFGCCGEFWACHRCHNAKSKCGKKKLRSLDIESIKCNRCGKVQEFPKERPYCVQCNLKFAGYFCPICKHLTGTNNKPYHCKECGICRVNRDKSFHCKICGYCMDICLKEKHKCRPNSAHDPCFICLEDAFTGCQILPCSHKVHKDCAQAMLRKGISKCPVCRESFAHKIDRRPVRK